MLFIMLGANSKTTQLISLQTQYLYHILVLYNVYIYINHKNYNFLDCDWFKKLLFSTNSLAKLLSDSLLLDSLLSDS